MLTHKIYIKGRYIFIYSLKKDNENKSVSYAVFPGIELIYNNFHSYHYKYGQHYRSGNLMLINYCSQGRIEWEFEKNRYFYLGEGDLSVHLYNPGQKLHFPLEHYHGISVLIDIDGVTTIAPMLHSFGVDLSLLCKNFCEKNKFYIERADRTIAHIFGELYTIPKEIRDTYIKIKILELFLFLSVLKVSSYCDEPLYIRKSDIEKAKGIRKYLIDHIDRHITLDELSKRFSVSQTSMKSHFKNVYGVPVYTFVRTYRIQKAARLLKNTTDNISEIALSVGYNNPSKFSSAFKDEMGLTPGEYRKQAD